MLVDGIDAASEPTARARAARRAARRARHLQAADCAREHRVLRRACRGSTLRRIAERTERLVDGARHARLHRPARRGLLAGPAHQDRDRARAGARSAQRPARRADQRPRRDDHALAAQLPARAARRGPLRAALEPHHAGGRAAVRPHRRHRARPRRRRRHARTSCAAATGCANLEDAFVKAIGSDEGLFA